LKSSKNSSTRKIPSVENEQAQISTPKAFTELGISKLFLGYWNEALHYFNTALVAQRQENDVQKSYKLPSLLCKVAVLFHFGLQYEAMVRLERAVEIQESMQLPSEIDLLAMTILLLELAKARHKKGYFVEALSSIRSALCITQKCRGEHHIDMAVMWFILARTTHSTKRYSEAVEAYMNSLEVLEKNESRKNHLFQLSARHVSDKNMFAHFVIIYWKDSNVV